MQIFCRRADVHPAVANTARKNGYVSTSQRPFNCTEAPHEMSHKYMKLKHKQNDTPPAPVKSLYLPHGGQTHDANARHATGTSTSFHHCYHPHDSTHCAETSMVKNKTILIFLVVLAPQLSHPPFTTFSTTSSSTLLFLLLYSPPPLPPAPPPLSSSSSILLLLYPPPPLSPSFSSSSSPLLHLLIFIFRLHTSGTPRLSTPSP